ncbi:MAG: hypothetical protein QM715_15820 [Nibricoccus sp.]
MFLVELLAVFSPKISRQIAFGIAIEQVHRWATYQNRRRERLADEGRKVSKFEGEKSILGDELLIGTEVAERPDVIRPHVLRGKFWQADFVAYEPGRQTILKHDCGGKFWFGGINAVLVFNHRSNFEGGKRKRLCVHAAFTITEFLAIVDVLRFYLSDVPGGCNGSRGQFRDALIVFAGDFNQREILNAARGKNFRSDIACRFRAVQGLVIEQDVLDENFSSCFGIDLRRGFSELCFVDFWPFSPVSRVCLRSGQSEKAEAP